MLGTWVGAFGAVALAALTPQELLKTLTLSVRHFGFTKTSRIGPQAVVFAEGLRVRLLGLARPVRSDEVMLVSVLFTVAACIRTCWRVAVSGSRGRPIVCQAALGVFPREFVTDDRALRL